MNPTERASHPSRAQIDMLLEFLERHPSLAKGFSKVPSAREANRKSWEQLSLQLNSIGGCVKSWKQWTKYWADKKSAVKRKAASRFQARNKTGGGGEIIQLSSVEERILCIMGGEGFAVGDRHLEINPFEDTLPQLQNDDSPSLINQEMMPTIQLSTTPDLTSPTHDTSNMVVPPETPQYYIECLPETSNPSSRPSVVRMVSPPVPVAPTARSQTPPRASGDTTPPLPLTPSGSGQHPQQRTTNVRRRLESSPPLSLTAGRHRFRRQRRLSPPSQRRSQYVSLSERFLILEEQRIAIERRNSEALMCIGEALKLLAENLRR